MTKCSQDQLEFPGCRGRKVESDFSGGDVTSDGGVLLLRQADRRLGLISQVARLLADPRRQASCEHTSLSMLRQRIYGLAAGYEDLNDHDTLRWDPAWQTAVERDKPAASSPTLCRLENRAERQSAIAMHQVLVEQFIASFAEAPTELILDFDATDDAVHGRQEGRFFHGYYDHYCFLPLYVFCGDRLLVAYLRPSNIDGARHAWAILSLLVKRFRQVWPHARIVFRGDSGFCRWRMLAWCERHDVHYIVGLAKNDRINEVAREQIERARQRFDATGRKQRMFGNLRYAAHTWDGPRRVIARIVTRPGAPIRATWSPTCRGTHESSMSGFIAPVAKWKTASRSSRCSSPTAPRLTAGGPISSGCCSRRWPIPCWRPSADWG